MLHARCMPAICSDKGTAAGQKCWRRCSCFQHVTYRHCMAGWGLPGGRPLSGGTIAMLHAKQISAYLLPMTT